MQKRQLSAPACRMSLYRAASTPAGSWLIAWGRVYVTHKDRLTRFGYGYLEKFFKAFGTKIIETEAKPDKNAQEELVEDMMSLLASFSGKLYGMRSSQRKKIALQAKEAVEEPAKQEQAEY